MSVRARVHDGGWGHTNIVPCVHSLLENTNVRTTVHDEAGYDICRGDWDVEWPMYTNLNRLISHVICSLTAPPQAFAVSA